MYGRDIQLAIKSQGPCIIMAPDGHEILLAEYIHPDTGERWWVEKGDWKENKYGGYHDALSFRHPGGKIEIRIAGNQARVTQLLLKRHEGLPRDILQIAWKAQLRLCTRFKRLRARGKVIKVVVVAIARELVAFMWAIARQIPAIA